MVHIFNPSTREAEAGGSLSLRPAWSTESSRTARATQRNPVSIEIIKFWGNVLVVKSVSCSYRGLGFSPQHPHQQLTQACNPSSSEF